MRDPKREFLVVSNPETVSQSKLIAAEQNATIDFIERFPMTMQMIMGFIGFDGKATLVSYYINSQIPAIALSFLPKIGDHEFGPARMNALIQMRSDNCLKIISNITDRVSDKIVYSMDLSDFDCRMLKWDEKDVAEFSDDKRASEYMDSIFWEALPDSYALKKEKPQNLEMGFSIS